MDSKQLRISNFFLRPFQFEGTAMHPNILIMCKLLLLLLLAHHLFEKIDDPFIPFISVLDSFNSIPGVFKISLQITFIISAFTLLFNIYVRTSVLVLGSIVILLMLSSKPLFRNHTFVCGCALFLAGLSNNKQPPYLLILQVSIIYFGAFINKVFDIDWWTGSFMHNWLAFETKNPIYLSAKEFFSGLWLAKILSVIAFGTEFLIGVLLLIKKYRNFGIWFMIIFHTLLFTLTTLRFGHFLESLFIILIAFLSWPKESIIVYFQPNRISFLKRLMALLNWDNKQIWKALSSGSKEWMIYEYEEKSYTNHTALRHLILYTPAFYIAFFGIDSILYYLLRHHQTLLFTLNVLFVWSVILYMLPMLWQKD